MMDPRSASAGLVHARTVCVLPAVAVDDVTFPGDKLSTVIVAPAVSLPVCAFVPVQPLISAITA